MIGTNTKSVHAFKATAKNLGGRAPLPPGTKRPVSFELIVATVCERFKVNPQVLCGKTRPLEVVDARGVIVHLARRLTMLSYPEIALRMYRPNHSSVITSHNRILRKPELEQLLAELEAQIRTASEAST